MVKDIKIHELCSKVAAINGWWIRYFYIWRCGEIGETHQT